MNQGVWRSFGLAALLLAAWAIVAPYLGPVFGLVVVTRPIVEVVDHVLPGVVVLGIALLTILTGRLSLPAALGAVLTSVWMAGTHIPLLLQVRSRRRTATERAVACRARHRSPRGHDGSGGLHLDRAGSSHYR